MELTRKQVIEELERFRLDSVYKSNKEKMIDKCLAYAISSLKTDEAYQIMYEGGEIFTKDDMVAMLEELKTEIGKTAEEEKNYDVKWALGLLLAKKIIQEKIQTLKENENDIYKQHESIK